MYQMEYELQQKKKRREMETHLLGRLKDGLLDGLVGKGFDMGVLTSHALIVEKEFETDEGKLWFLRNHGWKMEDVHAQLYSRIYKRPGAY